MAIEVKHAKGRMVEDEIRTSATPAQVWQAWTDPETISQWFTDSAEGAPREGTLFTWRFEEFGYEFPYKVVRAEPERCFCLGFEGQGPAPPGLLEISIRKDQGETVLRLVQSGFLEGGDWDEEYRGIRSGWRMALRTLGHYLENYFGRPKTSFILMRPASYEFSRLFPYFHQERLLSRWLTRSGSIGEEGDDCQLELQSGGQIQGKVLARSEREVEVSWPRNEGVLTLKAFSQGGPDKRQLGLHFVGWSLKDHEADQIREDLTPAVERLAGLFRK